MSEGLTFAGCQVLNAIWCIQGELFLKPETPWNTNVLALAKCHKRKMPLEDDAGNNSLTWASPKTSHSWFMEASSSWEPKGTPPVPPPQEISLISLNKALLGHYFLGRVALGVPLDCHEQCYSNFHTFQLGFQPTLMPRTARKVTGSADDPTGLSHLLPIRKLDNQKLFGFKPTSSIASFDAISSLPFELPVPKSSLLIPLVARHSVEDLSYVSILPSA